MSQLADVPMSLTAVAAAPASASSMVGGGETGRELRETDWAETPLGPADEWPEALKAAVATVLSSPQPMFMAWGPELASFFNDAYRPILGAKVEGAIGRPFADLWSDVWAEIEPIVAKALGGEGSVFRDMPLLMVRNGYPEETWWSFSYSPLRDGSGAVRGMAISTLACRWSPSRSRWTPSPSASKR